MAFTTPGAIRDALIARVAALAPAIEPRTRFTPWREDDDFRRWALGAAAACTRRFAVETSGDTSAPSVSSTVYERVGESMAIVVAYHDSLRQRSRKGLDDLIADDLERITYYAGTNGCAITPLIADVGLVVVSGTHRRERDPTSGVVFGVIPIDVTYLRSAP